MISDKNLFNLLTFIGVFDDHSKLCKKIFVILFLTFYYASVILVVAIHCLNLLFHQPVTCILYLSFNVLAMLIWFLLFVRRKKVSAIIHKLYSYRKQYAAVECSSPLLQKMSIILSLMIFMLYQSLHHFEQELMVPGALEYWTLGFKIANTKAKFTVTILINVVNFTRNAFPVLMTFILSTMLYKWSETLNLYKKHLQLQLRTVSRCENADLLLDFIKMTNCIRKMNTVLNYPLFNIILYSVVGLFVSLHDLMTWMHATYTECMSIVMYLMWSVLMLMMYSICSSMIPESLNEIRLIVNEKINEHVFGLVPPISQTILICLRRIETQKIIYITVFGMFRLTKSFILAAIGIAFTYDLLIISTFMDDNSKT